jgi:hypothetical protein
VSYERVTPLFVERVRDNKTLFGIDHAEVVKLKAADGRPLLPSRRPKLRENTPGHDRVILRESWCEQAARNGDEPQSSILREQPWVTLLHLVRVIEVPAFTELGIGCSLAGGSRHFLTVFFS